MSLDLFEAEKKQFARDFEAEFEAFWSTFPSRKGNPKGKARERWLILARAGDLPELSILLSAARAFARHHAKEKTEPKFIPHATTWLNQKRWNDWLSAPPPSAPVAAADWADKDPRWAAFKTFFISTIGAAGWNTWFSKARIEPSSNGRVLIVNSKFDKEKIEVQYEGLLERFFGHHISLKVG